jgi:hypothetical protein
VTDEFWVPTVSSEIIRRYPYRPCKAWSQYLFAGSGFSNRTPQSRSHMPRIPCSAGVRLGRATYVWTNLQGWVSSQRSCRQTWIALECQHHGAFESLATLVRLAGNIALGAVTFAFEVSYRQFDLKALLIRFDLSTPGGNEARGTRQEDYWPRRHDGVPLPFLARRQRTGKYQLLRADGGAISPPTCRMCIFHCRI